MAERIKRRMGSIILDSNIIIYLSKGLIDIEKVFKNNYKYYISVITYMEVLSYSFKSLKEENIVKLKLYGLMKRLLTK